jgi:uncharacterized protein with PIN domain
MKFILSKELGRLAKWLRILGFDAEYFQEETISALLVQALRDDRIILTRTQHFRRHLGIKIVVIHSERIKEQLVEVLKALNLRVNKAIMFSRCIMCNTPLVPVEKAQVKQKVPGYVFETQDNFITCVQCGRIYWKGTHWGNVQNTLKEIE